MKAVKIIVLTDEGKEETLNIVDGMIVALTDDGKLLTQTTENDSLNLRAIKVVLGK